MTSSPNPYAPPKAEVDDVVGGQTAPPLWNPNAAASWSLIFSPAFGAFLHMKNWQALGEAGKAANAKTWVIVSIAAVFGFGIVSALLPENKVLDALSRFIGLVLLLSWYYASGKAQVAFIKSRFGTQYPRRGWLQPILIALGVVVALIVVVAGVAIASSDAQA